MKRRDERRGEEKKVAKGKRRGGEDMRGVERIIVDDFLLKVVIRLTHLSNDVKVYYMTVWHNYRPIL